MIGKKAWILIAALYDRGPVPQFTDLMPSPRKGPRWVENGLHLLLAWESASGALVLPKKNALSPGLSRGTSRVPC